MPLRRQRNARQVLLLSVQPVLRRHVVAANRNVVPVAVRIAEVAVAQAAVLRPAAVVVIQEVRPLVVAVPIAEVAVAAEVVIVADTVVEVVTPVAAEVAEAAIVAADVGCQLFAVFLGTDGHQHCQNEKC